MTDNWWSSGRQDPAAIPFRNKFDAARDPLTARNAIGAVDAKFVADAIAAGGGGGGGAPTTAEYITASADPTLTAERVLTNTATVTWDFTTAGQAKANAAAGGGGNVSNSGTPTVGQYAKWVTATTIQGVAPATVLSDIGAQPAGSYQPLDADLTAIAALTGTNTIYYRSAADTWTAVTIGSNMTFSGGTLNSVAGGGGNVSNSGTPTAGQYAKWVTATTIQGAAAATVLSDIGAQPLDADLTSLAAASATNAIYYRSAANTWATVTVGAGLSFTSGTLAAAATWTAYTPAVTAGSGALTTVSVSGKYLTVGKLTHVQIGITISDNGTGASYIVAGLPHTPVGDAAFVGRELGITGKTVAGTVSGAGIIVVNYDATYPGGTGATLIISGSYENP